MKRSLTIGIAMLLCFSLAGNMTGCKEKVSTNSDPTAISSDWKALRYDNEVEINVGIFNPGSKWDMTNNAFITLCKDVLNIKITAAWCLDWAAHVQKTELVAVTNSLPDVTNLFNYQLFLQLVEGDRIADLSAAYNSESGAFLQSIYKTYPDSSPIQEVTFNNKMFAIPSTSFSGQNAMLWIRQDWLDELNLDPPSTLEQVFEVARAFVNNDPDGNGMKDTIGIPYNRWKLGATNQFGTIDPIYYALGAYPGKWLKDDKGEIFYGTATTEMKSAVGVVTNAVKEGIIDPFSLDGETFISSGKCGMFFGPWWASDGMLKTIHESDPKANWVAINAPLNSSSKFMIPSESAMDIVSGILVVRKDYAHPEAVMRVMTLWDKLCKGDASLVELYKDDEIPSGFDSPFNIQLGAQSTLYDGYTDFTKYGTAENADTLTISQKKQRELYIQFKDNPASMTTTDWAQAFANMVGRSTLNNPNIQYVKPAINQLNAAMSESFSAFHAYSMDSIFSIVGGANGIDAFDQLIADYHKMGGDETARLIKEYLVAKG